MKDQYILLRGVRFKIINENYLITDDESQIIYNGFSYRWNGFYHVGSKISGKETYTVRLHRDVWEFHNGKVPKGYHIHHIDFNRKNNDISNLQLLTKFDHGQLHGKHKNSWSQSQECKDFLRSMNHKATEWHRSEEGREWHRNHAKNSLPGLTGKKYKKTCEICLKKYFGKQAWQRWCTNKCKTKARYLAGKDDINRNCCICDKSFVINKYALKKTCSKKCSNISMVRTKLKPIK